MTQPTRKGRASLVVLAAGLIAAPFATGGAAEARPLKASVVVAHADLDLSEVDDVQALHKRIDRAVADVCGVPRRLLTHDTVIQRACAARARGDAEQQVERAVARAQARDQARDQARARIAGSPLGAP